MAILDKSRAVSLGAYAHDGVRKSSNLRMRSSQVTQPALPMKRAQGRLIALRVVGPSRGATDQCKGQEANRGHFGRLIHRYPAYTERSGTMQVSAHSRNDYNAVA